MQKINIQHQLSYFQFIQLNINIIIHYLIMVILNIILLTYNINNNLMRMYHKTILPLSLHHIILLKHY